MKKWRWKTAQWFELRWWKNYLHGKNRGEYLAWKKNYWKNIQERILDPKSLSEDQTVIDFGCGPAGIFIALPENKITAVDPLLNDYENQLPFFRKTDYPNVNFVSGNMEEFSSAGKFDFVFCMNAINHVNDIEKAFDVLANSANENGKIIFSIDSHNFSFFKFLFRLIPGDILHPHQYDLAEYQTFFEKRGLKILRSELLKKEFVFSHYLLLISN